MTDHSLNIRQLIDEHSDVLFRYAWRLSGSEADAEDLLQQTFLTAHRKLHQVQEPEAVRSWLFRILRNHYLKTLKKPNPSSLEKLPEPEASVEEDPTEFDSEVLQQALGEIPDEYRLPMLLFYFEERTYREISEQLDIPLGTVMSRLARGKEQLKQKLNALRATWDAP